ncbi:Transporter, MFS superfamily protein [Giardia duodenalis]|uniref:Transporter, MFS superfamily protein n=1 Tax=Giardia intestinalis TaxID=5741 RepID=V6TM49_GIAIN|nr:Transporter, MFS superfamily protein [Giardia intestinalis]
MIESAASDADNLLHNADPESLPSEDTPQDTCQTCDQIEVVSVQESTGEALPKERCCMRCRNKYKPGKASFLSQFPYLISIFASIGYDQQVMALALPQLSSVYGTTSSQMQWIITSFYIANAATSVLNGHVGNMVGPIIYTRILSIAAVCLYIASIFMPRLELIILLRIFSGYSASGLVACKNALTKSLSPPDKLQKYLMWQITAVNIIAVIIPFIGGELVDYMGWQSIFVVCAVLNLCTVINSFIIPNPYKTKLKVRFDYGGTILLTIAVTSFCLLFSFLAMNAFILTAIFAIMTIVFSIFFYLIERKVPYPLILFKALQNPIGAMYFVYVMLNVISSGYTILLPYVFTKKYGLSSLSIGMINGSSCVLRIVASAVTPLIDSRVVRRHIIGFAFLGSSVVTALGACFLGVHISLAIIMQMIQTFLLGVAGTLLFPMVLTTAPQKYSALMNGLPTMSRTMGSSIGNSLFTAIQNFILLIDYGQAEMSGPDDPYYIKSYVYGCQVSFFVVTGLAIMAGIISILRIRNSIEEKNKYLFKATQIPLPYDEDKVDDKEDKV